jgi:hypothetical protein
MVFIGLVCLHPLIAAPANSQFSLTRPFQGGLLACFEPLDISSDRRLVFPGKVGDFIVGNRGFCPYQFDNLPLEIR